MTQTMKNQELDLEKDKTYHKSIDALIEDVEIETEIETEKKIRSKNAQLFTIALVGIALVGLTVRHVSGTTYTGAALPELTKAKSAMEMVGVETAQSPYFLYGLDSDSDSALITESAFVASEKPELLSDKVTTNEAKVSPVAPVEKIAESKIVEVLTKEPAPQLIARVKI